LQAKLKTIEIGPNGYWPKIGINGYIGSQQLSGHKHTVLSRCFTV